MVHIFDRLLGKMDEKKTPLMIGLDPNLSKFPETILKESKFSIWQGMEAAAEVIKSFNFNIIDATHDLVPIYKPQSAYYEQYGSEGIRALEDTVKYAKEKGAMVCLDGKRNDIGPTSEAYAEAKLGKVLLPDGTYTRSSLDFDLLTVNGYLGTDGIKPFVEVCNRDGKGIFVLTKTSNPSAGELQDRVVEMKDKVYIEMAKLVKDWGSDGIGERGFSNIGAVVGATYPEEAEEIRRLFPQIFFLLPGYGAQGGKAQTLVNAFNEEGYGGVVNSSRGIIYAFSNNKFREKYPELAKPEKFAEAARQATSDSIIEINIALKEAGKLPKNWVN